ncbi:winged helix-turn-helix transcriptional regulator [Azospirillum sp. RWY-5-1]|uniref:Winged helix-turn-helix transcriptional regulator n=1 Tax=Azospirillum oleiclasticum TaxID=2735135 RepID=A0ABX2THE3_9PROT|nr:MarR family winged helix-turn-helix transcriptional regulator [Azospirillum oleiclasticum]NYZ15830.1 winged helix-turn-helix transcriptional regulator [Azospirillum oleiclasticum]NYZ22100.1 winged helix-turn-helix transcriptional regulator [Azospirillum oleiclasticum]
MSRSNASSRGIGETGDGQGPAILHLDDWLPYQFSYVSNEVSLFLEDIYRTRFGLTVSGWRVMAVLGLHAPLSAKQVAEHTAMDQVQVTRAINHLASLGLISRRVDSADRRKVVLRLSPRGRDVYGEIVPYAIEIERTLLSPLTAEELNCLRALTRKVVERAHQVFGRGGDDMEGAAEETKDTAQETSVR